ncbi:MAG: hypothetical protein AB1779_08930, partial [Candidatus Thermoplasmatota archaeon]
MLQKLYNKIFLCLILLFFQYGLAKCTANDIEPNDSIDNAAQICDGSYNCSFNLSDDTDWYKFYSEGTVNIFVKPEKGLDISVFIYNATQSML